MSLRESIGNWKDTGRSSIRALVFLSLGLLSTCLTGCKDKEAEKRIAELESKPQEKEDEQNKKENDPKAPSKENFARAIRERLFEAPHILYYEVGSLGNRGQKCEHPELVEAMKADGFLQNMNEERPNWHYALKSEIREAYFHPTGEVGFWEENLRLRIRVSDPDSVQVVRFSEPTPAIGKTISEVEYTFKWLAGNTFYREACPAMRAELERKGLFMESASTTAKAICQLFSDGWSTDAEPSSYYTDSRH